MTSKGVAVKTALEGMLTAALASMEGVEVTYGLPLKAPGRRWAAVGTVTWDESGWATNRGRSETFSVTVAFNVQDPGGDSRSAEATAWAMGAALEAALAADPGISDLCVTSSYRPVSLRSWPIDQAYEAQLDVSVTATCRP